MKKYSNDSNNQTFCSCAQCGEQGEKRIAPGISANLYAAEFLLYAFHFEQEHRRAEANSKLATSLMMMAVEG